MVSQKTCLNKNVLNALLNKKRNKRRLEKAKQFHHLPLRSETSSYTSKAEMESEAPSASEMSDRANTMFLQRRKEDKSDLFLAFLFLLKLVVALVY